MNGIYRSEAGRDLVQARYRELLARWPDRHPAAAGAYPPG